MAETEHRIQSDICVWFNNNYCLVHCSPRSLILAIPNGGDRSTVTASLSKSIGEYSGASDLLVIHRRRVIFVEIKIPTGKQSSKQIDFQKHVEQCGFEYHIIRSLTEFQNLIATM